MAEKSSNWFEKFLEEHGIEPSELESDETDEVTDEEVLSAGGTFVPTSRFSGADATETERIAGVAVEEREQGALKAGSAGHITLTVYGDGRRRTSYHASQEACGDFHAKRRESTRLLNRGYLEKCGTMPNPAPGGNPRVDAYRITEAGLAALVILDAEL